jgi:murein DD-endopeptidase MepM/ murein hydrolase activator NlpD
MPKAHRRSVVPLLALILFSTLILTRPANASSTVAFAYAGNPNANPDGTFPAGSRVYFDVQVGVFDQCSSVLVDWDDGTTTRVTTVNQIAHVSHVFDSSGTYYVSAAEQCGPSQNIGNYLKVQVTGGFGPFDTPEQALTFAVLALIILAIIFIVVRRTRAPKLAQSRSTTYPVLGGGAIFSNPEDHKRTRPMNNWQSDNAVDIDAKCGTPVVAMEEGVIGSRFGPLANETRNPLLSGNRLYLKTRYGQEYYYAHLQGIAAGIAPGARVKAGTVLGWVGAAGNPPVCHLHLGFKLGDPMSILARGQVMMADAPQRPPVTSGAEGQRFCAQCGTRLSAGAKFCMNCGARVD